MTPVVVQGGFTSDPTLVLLGKMSDSGLAQVHPGQSFMERVAFKAKTIPHQLARDCPYASKDRLIRQLSQEQPERPRW